jgi:hypothetical protein
MTPIVNTHVHVPPNFSAFTTPAEALRAAGEQQVRAFGVSNFFDQQVYAVIRDLAQAHQVLALYGLEFITFVPDLADRGIRVNDPANPGRMYLTGKGIDPFRAPTARAAAIAARVRAGNDDRAEQMVAQLGHHLAQAGFDPAWSSAELIAEVAARAEVPAGWVSLQERHIARAAQERLATLDPDQRAQVLQRAYGRPSAVPAEDAVGLQAELRARLLKAGTPGFAPEVALDFADAYAYILDLGGIPCYPILADGADPICEFEADPAQLAQQVRQLGLYAAELFPPRNQPAVLEQYVAALRAAGVIVMAGTEHNTMEQLPLDPRCAAGVVPPAARQAFYEATCLVAGHAEAIAQGHPGYVDPAGALTGVAGDLVRRGDGLIRARHLEE